MTGRADLVGVGGGAVVHGGDRDGGSAARAQERATVLNGTAAGVDIEIARGQRLAAPVVVAGAVRVHRQGVAGRLALGVDEAGVDQGSAACGLASRKNQSLISLPQRNWPL